MRNEPRATYSYSVHGDVIAIVDQDDGRSVTNDVDNVLGDIRGDGYDLARFRVIYRDTCGVWDQIILSDDGGCSFRSLNEKELPAALVKVAA